MELKLKLLAGAVMAATLVGCQDEAAPAAEEQGETIASITENSDAHEGYFTLYRDRDSGAVHMLIKADQIGEEFIYTAQVDNGVVDAGAFVGAYVGNGVLSTQRYYDRVEFVAENFSFYFDPESELARASHANISDAILGVQEIVAEDDESGDILIKVDDFLLSENLLQISNPNGGGEGFSLGGLDSSKSKVLELRSYPENSDFEIEYVYSNPAAGYGASAAVTDPRSVSIRVLHSFIDMPENNYQPRFADARVGTFNTQVTDLTSTSSTPYRDLVHRWHLEKQDPSAEVSDPVEPIVWWVENTTPAEWRDLIVSAGLEWNSAFEKAGFSNAVEVRVQPDDADWDAGDIRYNVLRWTSSPTPPFGGYGPSFVNPRTGQIIGADIMLEASFLNRRRVITNWLASDNINAEGHQQFLNDLIGHTCAASNYLQSSNIAAMSFAQFAESGSMDSDEMYEKIVHDSMHYLILHEMGHTLGMNHNMKATQFLSPQEAFDPEVVEERGLAGSVMDYPALNFAPRGMEQTRFYTVAPGPYDDWFIKFSYDPALDDPEKMAEHLALSTQPDLDFGNDADDMRNPGWGMDPRINIYDMSNDAVEYSELRLGLVNDVLSEMSPSDIDAGQTYDDLVVAVGAMLSEWTWAGRVSSRYIGGVYVDRAVQGQPGATQPYTPVEESRQREAMELLATYHFAPNAFPIKSEVLASLQNARRGFDHFGNPEDPRIHAAILSGQSSILDHLMHPTVTQRMVDTTLYGNTYTLDEMMDDLMEAIFAADMNGNINSMRQNLQTEYVSRLIMMAKNEEGAFGAQAAAMASLQLQELKDHFSRSRNVNRMTKAHSALIVSMIEDASK